MVGARDAFGRPAVGGEEVLALVNGEAFRAVEACTAEPDCGAYLISLPTLTAAMEYTFTMFVGSER